MRIRRRSLLGEIESQLLTALELLSAPFRLSSDDDSVDGSVKRAIELLV